MLLCVCVCCVYVYTALLNVCFLKIVSTGDDIKLFLSKTLWYVQQGSSNLYEQISEVLDHLEKPKLINSRGDSASDI